MTDMTMTCAELDVRLADYLNDALSAAERAAVDAHLAGCARCARVLAALDERPAAMAGLPMLAPKHDLWSGIAERIEPRVLTLGERPGGWRPRGASAPRGCSPPPGCS
jgi:anti-sigma factor RsiW